MLFIYIYGLTVLKLVLNFFHYNPDEEKIVQYPKKKQDTNEFNKSNPTLLIFNDKYKSFILLFLLHEKRGKQKGKINYVLTKAP